MFTPTTVTITIIIFAFGILISIIGTLFKKAIFKKLDEVSNEVKDNGIKTTKIKEELLTNYVRKEDFSANAKSHKDIWIEIGSIRERLVKVETKQ